MAEKATSSGLVAYDEHEDSDESSSGDEYLVPPLKRKRTAQGEGVFCLVRTLYNSPVVNL